MNKPELVKTARELMAEGKGLLAMDESNKTCLKRFGRYTIPQTAKLRKDCRDMLATASGLQEFVSGVILFDETIHQKRQDGSPLVEFIQSSGMIPGIKVDTGAHAMAGFPGESITEGLDNLGHRLADYARLRARFTKWRAVFSVDEHLPTPGCMEANAMMLARFAITSQEAGMVPIVEPEVLMDGSNDLQRCHEATGAVLKTLFAMLKSQQAEAEALLLKINMLLPGIKSREQKSPEEIADATLACLKAAVPSEVPGIVFLSGGQSPELATMRLNAICRRAGGSAPWPLSFSFSRALQEPVMAIWKGRQEHARAAQQELYKRARLSSLASRGAYDEKMEHEELPEQQAKAA